MGTDLGATVPNTKAPTIAPPGAPVLSDNNIGNKTVEQIGEINPDVRGTSENIQNLLDSPVVKILDQKGIIASSYGLMDMVTILSTTVGSKIGLASAPQNILGNTVDRNQKEGALVTALFMAVSSSNGSSLKVKYTNPNVSTNLQHVNSQHAGTHGGSVNCANVAEAVNATLKGNPASALSATEGTKVAQFEKEMGKQFTRDLSLDQIKKQVPKSGDQGYVFGYKVNDYSHYFNVKNEGGAIRFYDAQPSGEIALFNPTKEGFFNYWFMSGK